jgi:hypothetical protein
VGGVVGLYAGLEAGQHATAEAAAVLRVVAVAVVAGLGFLRLAMGADDAR